MKNSMPTLEQFVTIVKTNKKRLKKLYDDLAYARYLMYAAPGTDFSKPYVKNSTPQFDKITIDLDRIDRIEKKIKWYESMDVLYEKWIKILTGREEKIFRSVYMFGHSTTETALEYNVSKTLVYNYKLKLQNKWKQLSYNSDFLNIK